MSRRPSTVARPLPPLVLDGRLTQLATERFPAARADEPERPRSLLAR